MNTITLWGRASSANVQKARWALEEAGHAYTLREVGGRFGGLDTPEFLAMNPNRLVPVLQHGPLTLWESHAIVRYAAASGAGDLWPADPARRALIDQWTDWTATTFQPAWIALFWSLVRTPPGARSESAISKARDDTAAALGIMDRQLQDHDYLASDTISYADIVAGTAMFRLSTMDAGLPDLPAVAAWHERLKARPRFQKCVCISYEELRARSAP